VAIVGFKGGQGGVEQFPFRHDNDVVPGGDVVAAENLTDQTFSQVSLDGAADLFRRRDAQPSDRAFVGEDEDRGEASVDAGAVLVHVLELGAAADVFMRPEPGQITRC
jgi:hypothetical protein